MQTLDKMYVSDIDLSSQSCSHNLATEIQNKKEKSIENYAFNSDSTSKYFKAPHAERRDVVYKTLIRNIRRYLWNDFISGINTEEISTKTRGCEKFKFYIEKYYENNFENSLSDLLHENLETKNLFIEYISIFMTKYYFLPKMSPKWKKARSLIQKVVKNFSPFTYAKFFNLEGIPKFFEILKTSGMIQRVINARPNMKKCEEIYLKAVDSIISFDKCSELLKLCKVDEDKKI